MSEKPMAGIWTLTAPDGREYKDENPIKCCAAERDERISAKEQIENLVRGLYGFCELCEAEFAEYQERYFLGQDTPAEIGPLCGSCRGSILADAEDSERLRQEVDCLLQTVQRLAKIHKPKFQHHCHEWDGLEINEFCPEFDACTCYSEEEFDEGYQEFVQEMAVHCECCPICSPGPCDGVLAGGVCDKACHCQGDSEW